MGGEGMGGEDMGGEGMGGEERGREYCHKYLRLKETHYNLCIIQDTQKSDIHV